MTRLFSVVVTTYDRPDALVAVLDALARQTDRDFEVIIADDGSDDVTVAAIASWQIGIRGPIAPCLAATPGFSRR